MTKETWPPIWIGSVTEAEIGEKAAAPRRIEDLLNEHLRLSDYGTALAELRFVFVVLPLENERHPDDARYATRPHRLTIWRRLDYDRAREASEEELLQMVTEKFLAAIQEIPDFNIASFDHEAFHRDVTRVLEGEGLLEREKKKKIALAG